MLVQVFTFVSISLHVFGPCCSAPFDYVGNNDEAGGALTDTRTHSNDNRIRMIAVGHHKRLFTSHKELDEKNRQVDDIIQIPDDTFVTCKGCRPTDEKCSTTTQSATEKCSREK